MQVSSKENVLHLSSPEVLRVCGDQTSAALTVVRRGEMKTQRPTAL